MDGSRKINGHSTLNTGESCMEMTLAQLQVLRRGCVPITKLPHTLLASTWGSKDCKEPVQHLFCSGDQASVSSLIMIDVAISSCH